MDSKLKATKQTKDWDQVNPSLLVCSCGLFLVIFGLLVAIEKQRAGGRLGLGTRSPDAMNTELPSTSRDLWPMDRPTPVLAAALRSLRHNHAAAGLSIGHRDRRLGPAAAGFETSRRQVG